MKEMKEMKEMDMSERNYVRIDCDKCPSGEYGGPSLGFRKGTAKDWESYKESHEQVNVGHRVTITEYPG